VPKATKPARSKPPSAGAVKKKKAPPAAAKKKVLQAAPKKRASAPAAAARSATKKSAAGPKKFGRRADLGAPTTGFFDRQPAALRAILDDLRGLIDEAAPEASSEIKWGMPFYSIRGQMMCALAAFKAHVNLILAGPAGTFADPAGLLEGDGKTGRHLKLRAPEDLPRDTVRNWLRAAAARARTESANAK
jgi:hypothetical protein